MAIHIEIPSNIFLLLTMYVTIPSGMLCIIIAIIEMIPTLNREDCLLILSM